MGKTEGSSDEAIGRPGEWREGRYQKPGEAVDETVTTPPRAVEPQPVVSTPVTQLDYESLEKPPERE